MPRGMRTAVLVVGTVAVLVAAVLLVVGRGGTSYDASLVRHDDDRGEANRYTDLDDGEAQLAIGSPDGHEVVVQFRDPDGSGWTSPTTVWEDEANEFVDTTLRYGGGTAATALLFSPDTSSESDADDVVVALVCRASTVDCEARPLPGISSEPQVSPDGRTAWFSQSREGVVLWTDDDGFVEASWTGHPGFPAYDEPGERPSEPLLSPDGTLTVAATRPVGDACEVRLLRAERGTADLAELATATLDPRPSSAARVGGSGCAARLSTFSDDWVRVDHDAPLSVPTWFVRDGEEWVTTREDPSGLMPGREVLVAGFVSWNDVAWTSPDGRTIRVQSHRLGEERWSDPVLVGEGLVPAGARCEDPYEGYEVGDGAFAITMACEEGDERGALVVASPDLRDWEAEYVVARDPFAQVDDEAEELVVGPLTWSPEDGFGRR